MKASLY